MTAPVDASRIASTSGGTAQTEPITVSLPSGITAGDLLVVWLVLSNNQVTPVPTGWTHFYDVTNFAPTNHDNIWQNILYRIADGSEGSTLNVSLAGTAGSAKWCACAWRITGADTSAGTFIEVTADSNQVAGTTPDPPAITPAGGAKDYLILWCGLCSGTPSPMPPTGNPTGYSNPIGSQAGGGGAAGTKPNAFAASKQLSAATTENPPSWTISTSASISAQTIAIYPAAAGVTTDSATILVDLQASGIELAEWIDTATVAVDVAVTITGTDIHEIPDAATVYVDLQTSDTQVFEGTDSATVPLTLTVATPRTNYVVNGGFETDLSSTSPFGTNSRDTSEHLFGVASLKSVYLGPNPWNMGVAVGAAGTFPAGTTLTGSAYLKATGSMIGKNFDLQLRDAVANHSGDNNLILTSSWQRVSGTWTIGIDSSISVWIFGNDATITTGDTVFIDGVQLEIGATATPYIETDGAPVTVDAGVDIAQYVETATIYVDLQASGTDVYTPTLVPTPFARQPIIVGGMAYQDRSRW